MKTLLFLAGLLGARLMAADYMVHEWGTFTSVVGSDGRMLPGLEIEEERMPVFVHSFDGFAPRNKGWTRPVSGVTVKMETPVLYFYSAEPRTVHVAVRFRGGSISQWYPQRVGGEQLPGPPRPWELRMPQPVDFAPGREGFAEWRVDVLAADTPLALTARRDLETPQWPRARVSGANRVRGPSGEVEGFIFYRGLGNFRLPLDVKAEADGVLTVRNQGAATIPFVWVYEKPVRPRDPVRSWWGALAAGMVHQLPPPAFGVRAENIPFRAALVAAGLTAAEAAALEDTWRESYFEQPGLRIFWIVPRALTDAVLPIKITPQPAKLERVLVGRTGVLTREFEAALVRDFALDGGKGWEKDRYFRVYRERVRQIANVVGVAPATPNR